MKVCSSSISRLMATAGLLVSAGSHVPLTAADLPVKYMELNGARIAYVEQGQGEPLVLVHGAVSDYRTWERQLATLSRNYRVITYSQRYFGSEPWSKDWPPFGVSTHANDLAAFIEKLGIAPAHVVGWSYGASVGLVLAQQHPKLVKGAYLFEPAHPTWITDEAEKKALAESRAIFAPVGKAVKGGDNLAAASALLDGVEGSAGMLQTFPPEIQAVVKENARTLAVEQQAPPVITCEQLGRVNPGVTVARGDKTETFFRLAAESAARCMPNARHVVVPGAGHLWPGSDPASFSESVVSSLKGN